MSVIEHRHNLKRFYKRVKTIVSNLFQKQPKKYPNPFYVSCQILELREYLDLFFTQRHSPYSLRNMFSLKQLKSCYRQIYDQLSSKEDKFPILRDHSTQKWIYYFLIIYTVFYLDTFHTSSLLSFNGFLSSYNQYIEYIVCLIQRHPQYQRQIMTFSVYKYIKEIESEIELEHSNTITTNLSQDQIVQAIPEFRWMMDFLSEQMYSDLYQLSNS